MNGSGRSQAIAPKRSLVTGGTGFIGSHLIEALLGRGHHVRCLIRSTSPQKWIEGLNVEIAHGDCTEISSLRTALDGIDTVYHVAGVNRSVDPATFFRVNGLGTENLVRVCLEKKDPPRFVYVSSQAAAGPCMGDGLSVEADQCRPVSVYGRSKRKGEEAVLEVGDRLRGVILRPCAVYGPRDRDFLTIFRTISHGIQIGLWGLEPRISLCYVIDLVSAIVMAGEKELPSGETFFISDGRIYTLQDVEMAIARVLGVRPIPIRVPVSLLRVAAEFADRTSKKSGKPGIFGRDKYREMIQPNWCCDSTKATSELEFSPCFDLHKGVAATVSWYRKEGWL